MTNITFGLTGGICSGKSTATKTFIKHGIPMVDADVIAREVVAPGTEGLAAIVKHFGSAYLNADGTLHRAKLAQYVFGNAAALSLINQIMGDLIHKEGERQCKALHNQGHPLVGYDAALICEMGNSKKYRPLIVVHCPADVQLERLMTRNSLTRAEALARISSQMPVSEKMALADYLIDTSGTIEESIQQTESIINHLKLSLS